ncbi:MAG: BamA/TamA family outer membrane protein [Marinoscillum sp.]
MLSKLKTIRTFLVCIVLGACSVKKYIPENKHLFTEYDIKVSSPEKIKDKSEITSELENLLRPKPNAKILGMRIPLRAHYRHESGAGGFINKWVNKKVGEKPVYLSDVDLSRTEELINNRLENRGFFRSNIQTSTQVKKHTAELKFDVSVNIPYKMETYQLDTISLPIHELIQESMEQTLIKPGSRFDLSMMKAERERIDTYLKDKGYYNFNSSFLLFEADTNYYEEPKFDLYLRLKNNVPHSSTIPYRIKSIQVFPNYSLNQEKTNQDTVTIDRVDFIQKPVYFKPHLLPLYLLLKEGTRYNPTKSKLTSQRFSSIGTYKFVNIRHEEYLKTESTDSIGLLQTKIYLSPQTKRSIRAEVQAVAKSNNFAGPALMITYSNRNLFRGGELLNISGKVGYETQITGGANSGLSSTQFGFQSDLIFPRLEPFDLVSKFRYDVPKTKISLGVEYLNRSQLYTLRTLSSTYGYNWNASKFIYHNFNPISINLVNLSNTTDEFQTILEGNPFLASSFDQRFIGGLTYNFTYSELNNTRRNNQFYLNTNLDVAGNMINLLSTNTNESGKETFLGLEYAQYAKVDADLRYNILLGGSHRLVARVFGGIGLAYGNSDALPFSKQYFSGGPYSVRAFRIRSLGPGSYTSDGNVTGSFFDQTGDIRLEGNLEYRFPIVSILKGALFVDAGNVWLREENDSLGGGKFSSNFINELGMGAGAGLRVDIQNFVIRGDFAAPFHQPKPDGSGFEYKVDPPIFNFAIGYPF